MYRDTVVVTSYIAIGAKSLGVLVAEKIKLSRTNTLYDGSVLYVRLDNLLEEAGWYPGREIKIDQAVSFLEQRKFKIFETTKSILTMFGDLYICIHENIRLDLRFEIFDGDDAFNYVNFDKRSLEIIAYFFEDQVSPIGLMVFLYEGKDIYSVDEIYVSKYGDIVVLSDLGLYRYVDFQDFLFKVFHKKAGRELADIDQIEAAFPSEWAA